jgi:hypothetical protein
MRIVITTWGSLDIRRLIRPPRRGGRGAGQLGGWGEDAVRCDRVDGDSNNIADSLIVDWRLIGDRRLAIVDLIRGFEIGSWVLRRIGSRPAQCATSRRGLLESPGINHRIKSAIVNRQSPINLQSPINESAMTIAY